MRTVLIMALTGALACGGAKHLPAPATKASAPAGRAQPAPAPAPGRRFTLY